MIGRSPVPPKKGEFNLPKKWTKEMADFIFEKLRNKASSGYDYTYDQLIMLAEKQGYKMTQSEVKNFIYSNKNTLIEMGVRFTPRPDYWKEKVSKRTIRWMNSERRKNQKGNTAWKPKIFL